MTTHYNSLNVNAVTYLFKNLHLKKFRTKFNEFQISRLQKNLFKMYWNLLQELLNLIFVSKRKHEVSFVDYQNIQRLREIHVTRFDVLQCFCRSADDDVGFLNQHRLLYRQADLWCYIHTPYFPRALYRQVLYDRIDLIAQFSTRCQHESFNFLSARRLLHIQYFLYDGYRKCCGFSRTRASTNQHIFSFQQ